MGLGQLTGTSWHVGKFTRSEGDEKRHRGRCQFFEKGLCLKLENRCQGSARCAIYRERRADFQEELPTFRQVLEKQFYRGRMVVHPQFGAGQIKDLTDEKLIVTFYGDKTMTFALQFVLEKNIFHFTQ
ncbi:hypothetical protein K6V78_00910 [Streptococcus gallolyticus]|uniref:hypothetical protein n=1 Tax=Streptococcus hepaticus TaxID=3349163 RepID=UPI001C949579|nr:hypothetical protein [Streptococcus gallolyticus]MBY5040188.1 hypothetical protein [Streptococcus gallolyticus]